jgi:hypothetical protein
MKEYQTDGAVTRMADAKIPAKFYGKNEVKSPLAMPRNEECSRV